MLTHIKRKKRQENKARVKQIKNKKQTNRKPNLSWKISLDVPPLHLLSCQTLQKYQW